MNATDLEALAQMLRLESVRVRGRNLVCSCPFAPFRHIKADGSRGKDRKASFGITVNDTGESVYNCFHGSTRIITYDGVKPIGSLGGTTQRLLGGDGRWVTCPIHHFGKQKIWKLVLTRNGVTKEILTTAGHRWPVSASGQPYAPEREVITRALAPGDRIPSVFGSRPIAKQTSVSPFGVAHGFVFGDGTRDKNSSIAYFAPGKDEPLLQYFNGLQGVDRGDGVLRIGRLPRFFRNAPNLDEAPSYLHGWLAGYFSADGCVSEHGIASLSSANRQALEHVQMVCIRLGIGTYGIRRTERLGYGKAPTPLYSITFLNSTLAPEFFILPHHRQRFEKALRGRRFERTGWIVKVVSETEEVADVFCPTVPGHHSFVLEDNVKTKNCFACTSRGDLLYLCLELSELRNKDYSEVEDFVVQHEVASAFTAEEPREERGPQKPRRIAVQEQRDGNTYPEAEYEPFRGSVPRYALERGLSMEACKAWDLGHDPEEGRLMFPVRRQDGKLVGLKGRSYRNAKNKYFPYLPFSQGDYFYGENMLRPAQPDPRVVIVEGEIDAIKVWMAGYSGLALMGGSATTEHVRKLQVLDRPLVLLPDPDSTGDSWARSLAKRMKDLVGVSQVPAGYEADAGAMTSEEIRALVEQAKLVL